MYLWSFAGMVNSQEIQRNDEQSSIIGFVKFNVFQRNLSTIITCVVGLMFMVTADCIYLGGLSGTKQEIYLLLTSDLIDNNFFQSPQLHCFVMCFIAARSLSFSDLLTHPKSLRGYWTQRQSRVKSFNPLNSVQLCPEALTENVTCVDETNRWL